jgi:hypothetical protein
MIPARRSYFANRRSAVAGSGQPDRVAVCVSRPLTEIDPAKRTAQTFAQARKAQMLVPD